MKSASREVGKGRCRAYRLGGEEFVIIAETENDALDVTALGNRIREKIGYHRHIPPRQCMPFLQAYYEALRAHREQRMLYGRRKQDKHASEE